MQMAVALAAAGFAGGASVTNMEPRLLLEEERHTVNLFKGASDSVVHVTNMAMRRDRFSLRAHDVPQGTGSGFIWDKKGHIVTNCHVIKGGSGVRVRLTDNTEHVAKVVGLDYEKDIAVLRIDANPSQLKPLPVGESADLLVGQKTFAIGNPFGLDQTLTTGIVSAVGREIVGHAGKPIQDIIQTDAAMNPGNSGGPLINSSGQLIGVNTAIYSPSGVSAGVGFAIPSDTVAHSVSQIIANGRVVRPNLGVHIAPPHMSRKFGIQGVLVVGVKPGGACAKAGVVATTRDSQGELHLGDFIVAVDGNPVKSSHDIVAMLDKKRVGEKVALTLTRIESHEPQHQNTRVVSVRLQGAKE
jgi:S1-C subfamily serine protease